MRNRIGFSAFLLTVSLIMTAGCWDRREIEEAGIIAGIAIDCTQNTAFQEDTGQNGDESRRIVMTYQFVVPRGLRGGESSNVSRKKPYSNVSAEGSSIYRIINDFYSISSREPDFDYLKVMIISEEAARSFNIYKLLDAFLRHPEMPRNVSVVISEDNAASILDIEPELEDLPAFELNMVTRIEKEILTKLPVLTFGKMAGKLAGGKCFAVPRVVKEGDRLKVEGAAIIRAGEFKMAGWLDGSETEGLNWLTGEIQVGAVKTEDEQTGETISCSVSRVNSEIKPKLQNGSLSFTVEIESEGSISEDWHMSYDALKNEYVEKVEKAMEKEIKAKVLKTLDKIQKEYKTDVAGFGKQLEIKYPAAWREMKDGWDERFGNIPVEVSVKFRVRSYGRRGSRK